MPTSPVRAVIFDFDGTLADSEPAHERAIRAVIEPMGWSMGNQSFARFVGTSDKHCLSVLAIENGVEPTPGLLDQLQDRKRTLFLAELDAGAITPYPGALELVRACAARVPAAVCSGSRTPTVRATLERFGCLGLFSVIVGADQVARTKPDPEGYRLTLARLGLDASACVAIEDTQPGITAAKAAGLRVVAVAHTCAAEDLHAADRLVSSIADLSPESLGLEPRGPGLTRRA
jgi:HAD superfamily hydrolase (TIGR01509 family)